MDSVYMGKNYNAIIKIFSIIYMYLLTLATIGSLFIFSPEGFFSPRSVFNIKYITHYGVFLIFEYSKFILLLILILGIILLISDIAMIFTKWSIVPQVLILFGDIIYQITRFFEPNDKFPILYYIMGILIECVGIVLLVLYFVFNTNYKKTYN